MGMLSEFRDFAMRGNVIDMAVGIVIGGAFGKIVSSLVGDVIMPVVGMVTGGIDLSQYKYVIKDAVAEVKNEAGEVTTAAASEVAINFGVFANAIIDFIIIAFCIFLVIKAMNSAQKRFEKEKEDAPPPPPPKQEVLLGEIRDLLKAKG